MPLRNDSFTNGWTSLPYKEKRDIHQLFVRNEDQIYVFASAPCTECVELRCLEVNPGYPIDGNR